MTKALCIRLRKIRIKKGYTQKQIYDQIPIGMTSFHYWERGEKIPNEQKFTKWCELLGFVPDFKLKKITNDKV